MKSVRVAKEMQNKLMTYNSILQPSTGKNLCRAIPGVGEDLDIQKSPTGNEVNCYYNFGEQYGSSGTVMTRMVYKLSTALLDICLRETFPQAPTNVCGSIA